MKALKDTIADLQNSGRFKTTNGQDFYSAPYDRPWNLSNYHMFKVGTCDGLWYNTKKAFFILAIVNNCPGNGHFEDLLDWFYCSSVTSKLPLIIQEVGSLQNAAFGDFKVSDRFAKHLVEKRGFKRIASTDDYIKDLKSIEQEVRQKLKDKIYIKL